MHFVYLVFQKDDQTFHKCLQIEEYIKFDLMRIIYKPGHCSVLIQDALVNLPFQVYNPEVPEFTETDKICPYRTYIDKQSAYK
jgi:hypothetical protein